MYLPSVAPKELIRADYKTLKSYEHLQTTPEVEDLLFIQSLEGRAHNGAGMFHKRTYVNTTIDDIVLGLKRDPDTIKAQRQALIDAICRFAEGAINGEAPAHLVDASGEPLLGIPLFRDRKVNPRDILRGLYLGGLRDNPDIRKEAERLYHVKIGGGRCYIIDTKTMLSMNLDGESLAHDAHEEKIESYQKRGLIADVEGEVDTRSQRYFYIRHRLGPGQSDDSAMVLAGILYNADVALGVFLSDAIDTLEKYAPTFHDQDGNLSFKIGRGFKGLGLSLDDVYELTALCAIPEAEEHLIPDSSLRYLLSIDQSSGQCAFEAHLDFIQGKPVPPLPVSFKRILSNQFYEFINRRLANTAKFKKLAVPNLTVKELDRPIADILKKDYGIVPKDATIADVVKKFKETKSEILIVQDKNNKVVGIIRSADLMQYFNQNGKTHA